MQVRFLSRVPQKNYYICAMEQQIFIPDFKKEYTLSNSVEILLYPLSNGLNYRQKDLEQYSLYGKFKKGKYELNYKREVLEYNLEMKSDWEQRKIKNFFLISENKLQYPMLEKALEYINYPEAALVLTEAKVYVEKAFWINCGNDRFDIFTKKGIKQECEYYDLERKILSNIEEVEEKLEIERKKYFEYYNKLYDLAVEFGSDFSETISGKVPIKYKIDKGSKIKLLKLSYKDNRSFKTKIPFSLIKVNEEELVLKTEELSKFILN